MTETSAYMREFTKVFAHADNVLAFDPVDLAAAADWDLIRTIDDYDKRVRNFAARLRCAREATR
jgi:hypothetical protein